MHTMRRTQLFLLMVLLVGVFSGASAQNLDTHPMRGFMPNMEQLSSPVDNIDVAGGKLKLQIPLASLPRGKGGTGFDLNLEYESRIFDLDPHTERVWDGQNLVDYKYAHIEPITGTGGWTYNASNIYIEPELKNEVNENYDCPSMDDANHIRYRLLLPDGSMHILYMRGYEFMDQTGDGYYGLQIFNGSSNLCAQHWGWPEQYNGWLTLYTNDGSFLKLEIYVNGSANTWNEARLFFPDGRRIALWPSVMQIYDANNNYITIANVCESNCNELTTVIFDEPNNPNRAITIRYNTPHNQPSSYVLDRDEIEAPGPNGLVRYYVDWESMRVGGDNRTYSIGDHPVEGLKYNGLDYWIWTVKYIHLPLPETQANYPLPLGYPPANEKDSYEFGYWGNSNGFGYLDYMRMPSGAEYEYDWAPNTFLPQTIYFDATTISSRYYVSEKKIKHNPNASNNWPFSDLVWTFFHDSLTTTITNPDGGKVRHTFPQKQGSGWNANLVEKVEELNAAGQTYGTIRQRVWATNPVYEMLSQGNAYMSKEIVSMPNSSGALTNTKSAITTFTYDKNGNPLTKIEYDWVNYGVEIGSTIKRKTQYDYYVNGLQEASAVPVVDNANAYWNAHNTALWPTGTSRRLNAIRRLTIFEGSTAKAATEFVYDSPYSKGNVLNERRWDSVKSASLPSLGNLSSSNSQVLTYGYDAYGNLTDKYEPEVRTRITYDNNGALVTQVDTGYQTSALRTMQYSWLNGVAMGSKTDAQNGIIVSYTYDNVGRQTMAREQANSIYIRRTETIYDDVNRKVTVKNDLITEGDGKLQSINHYDQLGRVRRVQKSDGSPLANDTDGIKMDTIDRYVAGIGRQAVSTTPYRDLSDSTLEWSCTQHDLFGRVSEVAMFSGYPGSLPSAGCAGHSTPTGITTTAYDANSLGKWITVTDPAGKVRKQRSDALGRLVEIIEDPSGLNYGTTYTYNALDNLTQVTQGSQTRTFNYSSLGRLISATNPESGTINYAYFDSGDLFRKTDARNIWSENSYDPLHRILTKTYSDGTPPVTYEYWTATAPNIGQLKSITSSVASTAYYYDWLGKVTSSEHAINGYFGNLIFDYDWYLNGSLQAITYPSNKQVSYSVDDAGRTNKISATGINYADMTVLGAGMPAYSPDGRLVQAKLGNNHWITMDYHTPGTVTTYNLGTTQGAGDVTQLGYVFPATGNNGNLESQTITRSNLSTVLQSFYYDNLNRVQSANESSSWSRTYGYDRYGNRYVSASSVIPAAQSPEPTLPGHFNTANNRLTMTGTGYDSAGNQTTYSPFTLEYDAESRNTVVKSSGTPYVTFSYDGEGRRIKKITSSGTTYYAYDALGQLAAEYSTQTPISTGTSYMFTDMLGSVRTITNQSGNVVECYDYLPFGRMIGAAVNQRSSSCYPTSPDVNYSSKAPQKFTGKERDAETGLDYFGARYYSGPQGRFISADNFLNDTHKSNPQTWNLYAYARNNPLRFIDPTGEMVYVGELDDGERNSVISWMSYLYGCGGCVSYDSNMFLTLDTKGLSASVLEANWWLTEAITSTSYFANIKPRNKNKKVAFAKNQGPIDSVLWNETMKPADQILVDFDDVQYLMGDQQAIDTWLATLIPHEIRHRFPQMYTVPDDLRGTGPIVDAVNIMTDKLGLPHRMKYAAQVRNGIAEIPYTLKQVDRNGNSKENLLFLRWDQEKTGKGGK